MEYDALLKITDRIYEGYLKNNKMERLGKSMCTQGEEYEG